jgi:hypothetical protein
MHMLYPFYGILLLSNTVFPFKLNRLFQYKSVDSSRRHLRSRHKALSVSSEIKEFVDNEAFSIISSPDGIHSISFEVEGKPMKFETGMSVSFNSFPHFKIPFFHFFFIILVIINLKQNVLGRIGRQANGAVFASYDQTMVYSTACFQREAMPVDFTPLRVDYFARYSAVGQTVGAFHRRDSRGDDHEILVARYCCNIALPD